MSPYTEVIVFGLGAVASRLLRALENDHNFISIVGAIDKDKNKYGKSIGELLPSLSKFKNVRIYNSLEECLKNLNKTPDVMLHMTESKPAIIENQISAALEKGINVISASESMFYPNLRFPDFSSRLNRTALSAKVTVTGFGINPGFSFDSLPLLLARTTHNIKSITINRTIDVTGTGQGDIEHVGYGLTEKEFKYHLSKGNIVGHMGATDSLTLLAEYLNLKLTHIKEFWETKTASFEVDSGDPILGKLAPGRVIGISQKAEAYYKNNCVIKTTLKMFYEPQNFDLVEQDEIIIEGDMPIKLIIQPALQSLNGAANIIASSIIDVKKSNPGLVNYLDLPLGAHRRSKMKYKIDKSKTNKVGYTSICYDK